MTATAEPKRPRGRPPRNPTRYTTGEGYHDPWMNARSPALDGSCDLAEPQTSKRRVSCAGKVVNVGNGWQLCATHRALLWDCFDGDPRTRTDSPLTPRHPTCVGCGARITRRHCVRCKSCAQRAKASAPPQNKQRRAPPAS